VPDNLIKGDVKRGIPVAAYLELRHLIWRGDRR